MARLLHELILEQAERAPTAVAVVHRQASLDYATLASLIQAAACGLLALDLNRTERVAVYLPKRLETVAALFGTALAGGVFVPINPLLKAEQVAYILRDCNVRVLITAHNRADLLEPVLADCPDLHSLVLVDGTSSISRRLHHIQVTDWPDLLEANTSRVVTQTIDIDMGPTHQCRLHVGRAVLEDHRGDHHPNRAPGRLVTAASNGMPQTIASAPLTFFEYFRRMNDSAPACVGS